MGHGFQQATLVPEGIELMSTCWNWSDTQTVYWFGVGMLVVCVFPFWISKFDRTWRHAKLRRGSEPCNLTHHWDTHHPFFSRSNFRMGNHISSYQFYIALGLNSRQRHHPSCCARYRPRMCGSTDVLPEASDLHLGCSWGYLIGGLEHEFYCSIQLGIIIIPTVPTDELIFFRGVGSNHQPDYY